MATFSYLISSIFCSSSPHVVTGASAAFFVATALAEKRSAVGLPLLSIEIVPNLIAG
jgi:hypothetical protein